MYSFAIQQLFNAQKKDHTRFVFWKNCRSDIYVNWLSLY